MFFIIIFFFVVLMGREGGVDGRRAVGAAVWFWSFLWFFFFYFFLFFTLTIDYGLPMVVVVCNGGGDCGS